MQKVVHSSAVLALSMQGVNGGRVQHVCLFSRVRCCLVCGEEGSSWGAAVPARDSSHQLSLFVLLGPAHTLRGHTELVQLLQQFTLTPDLHRSCTLLNSLFKVSHVSRCSCPSVIRSWADLWLLDRTADVAW